jgi:hypothetical protein
VPPADRKYAGNRNGNFKHGVWTRENVETRRAVRGAFTGRGQGGPCLTDAAQ